ncbi:MAG TPA: glutathione S-transferase [Aestuariivirgaceae bacterium]|nr:glutathione S-transferase [Aestuariivirgaceae bacterium]
MKLYEDQRAPNPRRVRIFLAEKGIEVPRHQVDIMAEEHKDPALVKLNPFARLPILELDDGQVICESLAICRYFEAVQPEPRLFGTDALDQGLVEMWQRRVEQALFMPISYAFRHGHPRMAHLEVPQIKEWSEANLAKIAAMLDFLDGELGKRRFMAGDRFSVADITALCAVDFMKVVRLSLSDGHANLRRWHGEVSSRPSASA